MDPDQPGRLREDHLSGSEDAAAVATAQIETVAREQGIDVAEALVEESLTGSSVHDAALWRALFTAAEPVDPYRAVVFGERSIALAPGAGLAHRIAGLARSQGALSLAERMTLHCIEHERRARWARRHLRALEQLQGLKRLCVHGFPLPVSAPSPAFAPIEDRAVYWLHNSLPYANGGYATRSQGLLSGISRAGMDVIAYTRHGYPADLRRHRPDDSPELPTEDVVDGVVYRRLRSINTGRYQLPLDQYLRVYAERVVDTTMVERPAVLHAASFYWNGLAAAYAGRLLGLPTIYEIRGLKEVAHISRDPSWQGSEEHRMSVRLETAAAVAADHVFAITEAVRDEFIDRGVDPDRISTVPNCVDASAFRPSPRDAELERELALGGKVVIGYIGAFRDREGLDDLLVAGRMLLDRGFAFTLLLVGDGPERDRLNARVQELGLRAHAVLTGRVRFADVPRYYSLVDIAAFPRKPLLVSEMISPMKPFEALAMEKAVVVSSVAALAEIVDHGGTGLISEKGSCESLAAALGALIGDAGLRRRLGKNGREWVVANRSWDETGRRVAETYRMLQDGRRHNQRDKSPGFFSTPNLSTVVDLELRALETRVAELEARASEAEQKRSTPQGDHRASSGSKRSSAGVLTGRRAWPYVGGVMPSGIAERFRRRYGTKASG